MGKKNATKREDKGRQRKDKGREGKPCQQAGRLPIEAPPVATALAYHGITGMKADSIQADSTVAPHGRTAK